jgi:hypothetical protein
LTAEIIAGLAGEVEPPPAVDLSPELIRLDALAAALAQLAADVRIKVAR